MQRVSREANRNRLTISKLLGIAGCFGVFFATALYVENVGSWVVWFSVVPLLGGAYGTYKQGFTGFLEGAFYGVLVLPICLMFLMVVLLWMFLLSIIL